MGRGRCTQWTVVPDGVLWLVSSRGPCGPRINVVKERLESSPRATCPDPPARHQSFPCVAYSSHPGSARGPSLPPLPPPFDRRRVHAFPSVDGGAGLPFVMTCSYRSVLSGMFWEEGPSRETSLAFEFMSDLQKAPTRPSQPQGRQSLRGDLAQHFGEVRCMECRHTIREDHSRVTGAR